MATSEVKPGGGLVLHTGMIPTFSQYDLEPGHWDDFNFVISHGSRAGDVFCDFWEQTLTGTEMPFGLRQMVDYHDIGKLKLPRGICSKKGPLSSLEWRYMMKHPEYGSEMIRQLLPHTDTRTVKQHHERWDGLGYPGGLKGKEISYFARMLTVVDVWDALTSARCYKKIYSPGEAWQNIKSRRELDFDPEMVDRFESFLKFKGYRV